MLKTVTLTAKQWSMPLTSVGHHINVVLAAGTIKCRLRQGDDSLQTDLVSGMAFRTDEQYSQVQFYSETAQVIKVWVGQLPLDYSPANARLVGSAALASDSASLFYGNPQLILPAETLRGKVVMQSDKQWYVGGAGAHVGNMILVAAGEKFETTTEGAVYGRSNDAGDTPVYSTELTSMTPSYNEDKGAQAYHAHLNTIKDDVLYFDHTGLLKREPRAGGASIVIPTGLTGYSADTQESFIKNGYFYTFGFASGDFAVSKIDLTNYTYEVVPLVTGAAFSSMQSCWVHKKSKILVFGVVGTAQTWLVNLDGSNPQQVDMTNCPSHASRGFMFADETIAVLSGDTSQLHTTSDMGTTWKTVVLPQNIDYFQRQWSLDEATSAFYYSGDATKPAAIYQTEDNGASWKTISLSSDAYSVYVANNKAYIGGLNRAMYVDVPTGGQIFADTLAGLSSGLGFTVADSGALVYSGGGGVIRIYDGSLNLAGGAPVRILKEVS